MTRAASSGRTSSTGPGGRRSGSSSWTRRAGWASAARWITERHGGPVSLALLPLLLLSADPVTLRGHKHTVPCLAFSRDGGRLASGGKDGDVIVWDVARREALHRLGG